MPSLSLSRVEEGLYSARHGQSPVREAGVDLVQGPLLTDRQTHTTENITLATPSSDSKNYSRSRPSFRIRI